MDPAKRSQRSRGQDNFARKKTELTIGIVFGFAEESQQNNGRSTAGQTACKDATSLHNS
jgi:hypothetical protein